MRSNNAALPVAPSHRDCYVNFIPSVWEDDMRQFLTYALFAILWPLAFAVVYSALERAFPNVLTPNHTTSDDRLFG